MKGDVKRRLHPSRPSEPFFDSQPPLLSRKFLKPRHHTSLALAACCSLEIRRSDLWPRLPDVGCRPVFYLRLRPLAVSAYCSLRSVPGGIQLSLVLRRALGAAHGTQAHVILPPNLSGPLPARRQSPGVP